MKPARQLEIIQEYISTSQETDEEIILHLIEETGAHPDLINEQLRNRVPQDKEFNYLENI
jgi:hypothetical protein